MKGGLGRDVYGLVSTLVTAKGWPASRSARPLRAVLVEHRDVVALGPALRVEVAAAGDRGARRSWRATAVKAGSVGKAALRSQ